MKKDEKRDELVSTRTRIEKLGVKAGAEVLLLGIEADASSWTNCAPRARRSAPAATRRWT